MRFTIRMLLTATALVAGYFAICHKQHSDPVIALIEGDVELNTGLLNDLLQQAGLPQEQKSLENVVEIRFPYGSQPTLNELRLLTRFKHLRSLYLPCEIPKGGMHVLKGCTKLEELSLSNSNASDEMLSVLAQFPSLKYIATKNTRITESAFRTILLPRLENAR